MSDSLEVKTLKARIDGLTTYVGECRDQNNHLLEINAKLLELNRHFQERIIELERELAANQVGNAIQSGIDWLMSFYGYKT